MKNLILIITILCSYSFFSQNIYTKDNIDLGEKFMFLKSCIDGFDKENINLNGMIINKNQYCSCFCDNVIPHILSIELLEAIKNDNILSLFFEGNNRNLMLRCIENHVKIKDDYVFSNNELNVFQKEFTIKNCVEEVLGSLDQGQNWTKSNAEKYCTCAMNSLYSKGYTFKDIQDIENESSIAFNEIVMPCIKKVSNKLDNPSKKFENRYIASDISGPVSSSEIRLIDYSDGFKIKIEIEGIVKYFLFDTGAADLVINRNFERELLLSGAIDKNNYQGKSKYVLADNREVIADILNIKNLKIGDFILNNVYIAVLDEGGMLCGKSFLDKFKNWEFNKKKSTLTIYK